MDSLWTLFTEHYPEHVSVQRGRKTLGKIKEQFRVLILDLYVCWLEDPEQYLGVHLGKTAYTSNSRYNSLFISFKLVGLIHQCRALGWWIGSILVMPVLKGEGIGQLASGRVIS